MSLSHLEHIPTRCRLDQVLRDRVRNGCNGSLSLVNGLVDLQPDFAWDRAGQYVEQLIGAGLLERRDTYAAVLQSRVFISPHR